MIIVRKATHLHGRVAGAQHAAPRQRQLLGDGDFFA
jgi:hypothetical protein